MTSTGVDTNILLRLIVEDEPEQANTARAFFASRSADVTIFVSWIVLAELVWTLRSRYAYPMPRILDVVSAFCHRSDIVVERAELVLQAIDFTRSGAEFADALIALGNEAAGCDRTVTFDRQASQKLPSMLLLA